MKRTGYKALAVIAAAGIMTAGLSVTAMAAGIGDRGGFGGFESGMSAPAEAGSLENVPEAKDQRPELAPPVNEDGSAAGEITDLQTPPEAPVDENGNPIAPPTDENGNPVAPPEGMQNGQMPGMQNGQMPGQQDIARLIESIEDEDTQSDIQALADSLKEAMDAEKAAIESGDTDEDDMEELRSAVKSAREALDEAVKTYLDANAPE